MPTIPLKKKQTVLDVKPIFMYLQVKLRISYPLPFPKLSNHQTKLHKKNCGLFNELDPNPPISVIPITVTVP